MARRKEMERDIESPKRLHIRIILMIVPHDHLGLISLPIHCLKKQV